MNRNLHQLAIALVLTSGLLAGCGTTRVASSVTDAGFFPMEKGTRWEYSVTAARPVPGIQFVPTNTSTITVQVLETYQREGVSAALLSTFPGPQVGRTGDAPARRVLLRTSVGRYHLLDGERWGQLAARIADGNDVLHGLVESDSMFLDAPLAVGKTIGGDKQTARVDRSYCWVVESCGARKIGGVQGLSRSRRDECVLRMRTHEDVQRVHFAPGVGVTRYEYVRTGTAESSTLVLKSFAPASRSK